MQIDELDQTMSSQHSFENHADYVIYSGDHGGGCNSGNCLCGSYGPRHCIQLETIPTTVTFDDSHSGG